MNLDQLLTEAAHHVADRVDPPEVDLDAVRTRAHASRRRTTALAVTAAAVVAALIGVPLLADHDRSTAPQPAEPPSRIIWTLPDADCAVGPCLKPRTYGIPLGQDGSAHRLRATVTIRTGGWEAEGLRHRIYRANAEGAVALAVYQVDKLAGPQPCDLNPASTRVATDATVDEVARRLGILPQFAVVDGARALPAFGQDTDT